MGRPRVIVLCWVALALVCSRASAQDTSPCTEEVSAAVGPIQSQLASATAERDHAQSEFTACRDSYAKLYESWKQQDAEIASLQGSISDLTARLAAADGQLLQVRSSQSKLDLPTLAVAATQLAKDTAASCMHTARVIWQELQQGRTDTLSRVAAGTLSVLRGATSSTWAFIKAEADEHVPDSVKIHVRGIMSQATQLWKQHISDAAWAQPVIHQLALIQEEVKRVISQALMSSPVLSPLADPVTVQLMSYAVFGLPALVLLALPVALRRNQVLENSSAKQGGRVRSSKKKAKRA